MTAQAQQVSEATASSQAGLAVDANQTWNDDPGLKLNDNHAYRSGAYRMLAAMLRSSPDETLLDHLSGLSEIEINNSDLTVAMSMLGLAARRCDSQAVDHEYHALFIGLGRGELIPYGSWYMTGFLMEKPLGELRDDLVEMGFERADDVYEPEDHIAALCEVMSMLIDETPASDDFSKQQSRLFERHIAPWADRFFQDLSESESAVFYRSVGRFGAAFMEFERR